MKNKKKIINPIIIFLVIIVITPTAFAQLNVTQQFPEYTELKDNNYDNAARYDFTVTDYITGWDNFTITVYDNDNNSANLGTFNSNQTHYPFGSGFILDLRHNFGGNSIIGFAELYSPSNLFNLTLQAQFFNSTNNTTLNNFTIAYIEYIPPPNLTGIFKENHPINFKIIPDVDGYNNLRLGNITTTYIDDEFYDFNGSEVQIEIRKLSDNSLIDTINLTDYNESATPRFTEKNVTLDNETLFTITSSSDELQFNNLLKPFVNVTLNVTHKNQYSKTNIIDATTYRNFENQSYIDIKNLTNESKFGVNYYELYLRDFEGLNDYEGFYSVEMIDVYNNNTSITFNSTGTATSHQDNNQNIEIWSTMYKISNHLVFKPYGFDIELMNDTAFYFPLKVTLQDGELYEFIIYNNLTPENINYEWTNSQEQESNSEEQETGVINNVFKGAFEILMLLLVLTILFSVLGIKTQKNRRGNRKWFMKV